jgi:hypothetical protein
MYPIIKYDDKRSIQALSATRPKMKHMISEAPDFTDTLLELDPSGSLDHSTISLFEGIGYSARDHKHAARSGASSC